VRPADRVARVEFRGALPGPSRSEDRSNGLPCILLKEVFCSAVKTSVICLVAVVRIFSCSLRILSNWARNSSLPKSGAATWRAATLQTILA